jgi:endonuclease/exonuclease/phosphatase family metal-dependent hydrolase
VAILRLGTFNLLHGMSVADQQTDPARLSAAAKELSSDVLGLQEVDRAQERSGLVDQTALVAEAMGAAHFRFVPAVHGTPGPQAGWQPAAADDGQDTVGPTYGVGLVSRLPVAHWRVRRFEPAPHRLPLLIPAQPRPRVMWIPDEPRIALAAVMDGPRGPISVVTAHLSFVPGYNARQLRRIARWVQDLPRPLFLLGDFNLPGRLPARLTGYTPLAVTPTYPSWKPRIQLDHVLADGLGPDRVRRVSMRPLAVSDHCALTVDVEL